MDTNNLIADIKLRFNHYESKKYLEEKYLNQLIFADQGGIWKITPELLSFLKHCTEPTIMLDIHNKPVKIDSQNLYSKLEQHYRDVTTRWHAEYSELSKNR